ncbi:EamA domain-containing membrane protein RarD [Lutibacter agarilyticus]|uniref:EamA domain-containing membrane protein RarD n=1 Tax=Lutibacter agarilyticus TaxID=1109740 RepID=A0A238Y134_9FLAO|nr:EamA family transporter [Lutibacter agarilyticus]SNR64682.1 EamA domain-containing membrane protein RarD [Lutibacter agarilyticus]
MPKTNLKNYLHLHLLVFIWGFTAILGALINIDAIPLVWYRMLIATVIVFIYFIVRKKPLKVNPKALLKFFIGGVLIALHWIFFFSAIKVSNISVALVSMSTGALFTSLIEPFFFKRKLIPLELIFGLIVVGGLYLIFNVESQYTLGIVYALIAAFLSALFTVLNGLYIQKHNADVISFYQLFFGVAFITIYILFTTGFTTESFSLTNSDMLYLFILSSICTAYAFIVSVQIMKHLTPYTVMLTINLEPVYAIILALLIFGDKEKMSTPFYFGALIILITVITNGILKNKKKA